MTEWSSSIAIKTINPESGETLWKFANDAADSIKCHISWSSDKNRMIVSTKNIDQTTPVFTEAPIASICVGKHANRVCYSCCFIGLGKITVHETVSTISFCDRACMGRADDFIDCCGDLIQHITNNGHHGFIDQCRLLVEILYARNILRNNLVLTKVLLMERNMHIVSSELDELAIKLYDDIHKFSPNLLHETDSPLLIAELLRAIKYNSQSLVIPSLPGTYFLCLFNTMSKLNHSCSPNSQIMLSFSSDGLATGTLIACNQIREKEELEISYFTTLNMNWEARSALLEGASSFRCSCPRCSFERQSDRPYIETLSIGMRTLGCFSEIKDKSSDQLSLAEVKKMVLLFDGLYIMVAFRTPGNTISASGFPVTCYDMYAVLMTCLAFLRSFAKDSGEASVNVEITEFEVAVCVAISKLWTSFSGKYSYERFQMIFYGIIAARYYVNLLCTMEKEKLDAKSYADIKYSLDEGLEILNFYSPKIPFGSEYAKGTLNSIFDRYRNIINDLGSKIFKHCIKK